jgi:hypothetical protein
MVWWILKYKTQNNGMTWQFHYGLYIQKNKTGFLGDIYTPMCIAAVCPKVEIIQCLSMDEEVSKPSQRKNGIHFPGAEGRRKGKL